MPFGRRRPLMRAAVIGGGAYAVGKHRQRGQTAEAEQEQSQDQRISDLEQQQQAPAPAAAAPAAAAVAAPAAAAGGGAGGGDMVSQLKELASLKDAGALNDAEFETAKQKLLAG